MKRRETAGPVLEKPGTEKTGDRRVTARRGMLLGAVLLLLLGVWAGPRLYGEWLEHLPTGQLASYNAEHPGDRNTVQLLARRYLDEGKAADAETVAASALEKEPENPPLWLLRSRAELELGKLGPAYASLEVAMPYLQKSADAHWILGRLLSRRGDDAGMLREWRQAEALDPNHPGVCMDLARDELSHLQYSRAATHIQRILQRNPRNYDALVLRAEVRQNTGDLPGAEKDARAVVQVAPENASSWQALGEVLHLRGTPDALREAERCFRKALQIAPDAWEVHQHLGQLLFSQGRYADAAAELEQALRSNDLNPIPYPTLMQCYLRLGRKAEVPRLQAKYHKIEEIDLSTGPLEYTVEAMPENTAVRLKLARLYKKFGRPDMALSQIDAVLKINPNLPEALRLKDEWKTARP